MSKLLKLDCVLVCLIPCLLDNLINKLPKYLVKYRKKQEVPKFLILVSRKKEAFSGLCTPLYLLCKNTRPNAPKYKFYLWLYILFRPQSIHSAAFIEFSRFLEHPLNSHQNQSRDSPLPEHTSPSMVLEMVQDIHVLKHV